MYQANTQQENIVIVIHDFNFIDNIIRPECEFIQEEKEERVEKDDVTRVSFRTRKQSLKKSRSNDRRVRNQLKLVHLIEMSKDDDKIGMFSKRSLRVNNKTINKTPFKTTNLGKKRLNSKMMYSRVFKEEE